MIQRIMATGGSQAKENSIRFGEFELDLSHQALAKGGVRLKLQNQPCQVLALLIRRAPEIVSRDEIRAQIWGDNAYIDVERNINFCIRQIRSVLLDSAAAPRYIETLPRQGYRFVAPLEGPVPPDKTANDRLPENDYEIPIAPAKPPSHSRLLMLSMAFAAMIIAAASAFWVVTRNVPVTVSGIFPVTNYAGDEVEPSLSPDGRQVAFSWNGEDGRSHIYVKLLGEQHALRLTHDSAADGFPAWSPDGKHIAFMRSRTDSESDIILVPPIGGPERILQRVQTGYFVSGAGRMMAWTPDSKWLCFTSELAPGSRHTLFLLSLDTGKVRPMFARSASAAGESSPAFSPDGRWLAFGLYYSPSTSKLFIQHLTTTLEPDGEPVSISNTSSNPTTPVWQSDNKHILFLDYDGSGGSKMFRASIGGVAQLVYSSSAELSGVTIDNSGKRLILSQRLHDPDVLMMPLKGLAVAGGVKRVAYSTASECQPRFSPDGRWLAFGSNRSGASEIWIADSDGENPRQLTHLGAYIAGYPKWSPDSKFLVFHARLPDEGQIYTIRVQDGATRQITHDIPGFADASFSWDGQAIYMLRDIISAPSLYRVSLVHPNLEPLWRGCCALEAPGRHLLLYAKPEQRGIYARSLAGMVPAQNEETRLLEDYVPPDGRFEPTSDGIYYVGCTPMGQPRAFRFYSFASGRSTDIALTPPSYAGDLSVSPDRARLAYTAEAKGSQDLVQLDLK